MAAEIFNTVISYRNLRGINRLEED